MISIGIDPDAKGAIVALNDRRDVLYQARIPLQGKEPDEAAIWTHLRTILVGNLNAPMVVVLERLTPLPATMGGVRANYRRGQWRGTFRAIAIGLGLPLEEPTPLMWQRKVLAGIDGKDSKARAMRRATQAVPGLDLLPDKVRKPHQGLADACCLAEYGIMVRG